MNEWDERMHAKYRWWPALEWVVILSPIIAFAWLVTR